MKKLTFINKDKEKLIIGKNSPYFLSSINGTELTAIHIHSHKSPNQDGETYIGNTLEYRPITIEGAIREIDNKKVMQLRHNMLKVLNPKLHLCKLVYEYDGGVKTINCIVDGSPTFHKSPRDVFQRFLIHLYCPDPFWRDLKESGIDLVTWIPNLEFDAVEGFSTEQLENHWIETQIKKQGLQVFKKGTIYLELEEESTVPEVEIAYLLENGQYKRLRQQATVFSTGTGYDENGNYVDVSDSIVNGQISGVLYGLTATNIINNGNFANGTSGWLGTNATISVSNNIMKVVPDGSAKNGWLVQNTSYSIFPSRKYFVKAKLRVTNNDCVRMRVLIRSTGGSGDSIYTITAPVANQWYSLAIILDSQATHAGNFRLLFDHDYADAATANGKIMEVQEVMVIDLIAHGLESKTEEELAKMFANYFDGTKSTVSASRLKSVGKNLCDGIFELGSISTTNGLPYSSSTQQRNTKFIAVESGTAYTLSGNNLAGILKAILCYDSSLNYITAMTNTASALLTITTPANTRFIRIRIDTANQLANIQLEKGSVATPYEPYTESNAYVIAKDEEGNIAELRSLPNGVKDEIRASEGKLIKRVSDEYTIKVTDIKGLSSDFTNVDQVTVELPPDFVKSHGMGKFKSELREVDRNDRDNINSIGALSNFGNGTLRYIIEKGTTREQAQQQLAGTTLTYQLANPIVKLLPPEPLTTFEEFESGFGTGQAVELGYRLTKQIVEVDNIGDVETPIRAIFRAHGTVEKPYIQDVETREMLRINRTLQAGDVLEITTEFGNKNVYLNGEKAHHYLDYLNSTWLQLKPGINLIKYGAESGTEVLECRLYFTPRYLGV